MRLGLASDLHVTTAPAREAAWHNPYDFAGLSGRLDAARAVFGRAGVDAVVACGDVADDGDEPSVRAALERLSDSGRPVLAVAGNHDCVERDDGLARSLPAGCAMLPGAEVEVGGVRVAGVAIERDPATGKFRWTGGAELAGGDGLRVVASHFPVLSRARRLAERGMPYPGDLTNRRALQERLTGAGPVVVLSGHIHVRESHAQDDLLQLSSGALVEAPYEVAIVEVAVAGREVTVRRRVHALGPSAGARDPVLAPQDETWAYGPGGWTLAGGAAEPAA